MQIYEYIQHPCTTLHLTGRASRPPKVNDGQDAVLRQLIAEARPAASHLSGATGTVGTAEA